MCTHHKARRSETAFERAPASATRPYEGATTRLDYGATQNAQPRRGGFPWWTLWLIWPASALIKHTTMPMWSMLQTTWNPATAAQVLGAVALIIIGLALLRRN